MSIEFNEGEITFSQTLDLLKEVDKDKSDYHKSGYQTIINLVKKENGFWKGVT